MKVGFLGALLGGFLLAASVAQAAPPSAVFDQTCAICHQAGGVGAPGEFPRLAGRAASLARFPLGRRLMIAAVLNGSIGRVQADHQTIMGVMPAFNQLTDVQACEALNYIASLDGGSAPPFTPAEVAAVRAHPMSPNEVNALARDPTVEAAAP
ncbi:MAG: cytochrome c [Caulobacteraceae bacterium]|nr:cytochrome c [Caulobacteraceae bacterium]